MKILFLNLFMIIGLAATAQQQTGMVSVSGEGKITVVPDQATITLGVETTGADAQKVKAENDKAIDAVIRFAKKMSIGANNIETQYINLNKNIDYQTKDTSYVASQMINIKIEKLDRYDELLTGFMEQGVNTIRNVVFSSSKMEDYKKTARTKAIQNAKAKAEQYVAVLGEKLGKVASIAEQGVSTIQPREAFRKSNVMMLEDSSSFGNSLAPGEMDIIELIEVSFYLQ